LSLQELKTNSSKKFQNKDNSDKIQLRVIYNILKFNLIAIARIFAGRILLMKRLLTSPTRTLEKKFCSFEPTRLVVFGLKWLEKVLRRRKLVISIISHAACSCSARACQHISWLLKMWRLC